VLADIDDRLQLRQVQVRIAGTHLNGIKEIVELFMVSIFNYFIVFQPTYQILLLGAKKHLFRIFKLKFLGEIFFRF